MINETLEIKDKLFNKINPLEDCNIYTKLVSPYTNKIYLAAILKRRNTLIVSKVTRIVDSFGERFKIGVEPLKIFDYDEWDDAFEYFWQQADGDWFLKKGLKLTFEPDTDEPGFILFREEPYVTNKN
jgi:hypothetical protein